MLRSLGIGACAVLLAASPVLCVIWYWW